MFKLEQAITDWRRQMAGSGIQSPDVLDELESHLREDLQRQLRSGLSVEPAFLAAVQRLGSARALSAEFATQVATKEAQARRLKLLCVAGAVSAYLAPLLLSAPKPWSDMTATEQALGLAAVALSALSPFSGLLMWRFLPVVSDPRLRTRVQFAAAVPAFVGLCVYAFVILPGLVLTLGEITVATLWAMCPLAVFGGLILGLDEAAHRGYRRVEPRLYE